MHDRSASSCPLFVGGAERSGTTFVAAEIAKRTGLTFLPEAHFLAPCIQADQDGGFSAHRLERSWRLQTWGPDIDALTAGVHPDQRARECFELVVSNYAKAIGNSHEPGQYRWVDHSPHNLLYFDALSVAYPNAVFVHVIRDGRAVFNSARATNFGPLGAVDAANRWLRQVSWGLAAEQRSPDVIRIRYEDVVQNRDGVLDEVIERIGAADRPPVINVGKLTAREHELVDGPPDATRIDAWRNDLSSRSIGTFEALAGPTLSMLGYERITTTTHLSQPSLYGRMFASSAAQLLVRIPFRQVKHEMFRLSARARRLGKRSGRRA